MEVSKKQVLQTRLPTRDLFGLKNCDRYSLIKVLYLTISTLPSRGILIMYKPKNSTLLR